MRKNKCRRKRSLPGTVAPDKGRSCRAVNVEIPEVDLSPFRVEEKIPALQISFNITVNIGG